MVVKAPQNAENEKIGEMAPLFFFLASSLNTELVYIILKSVTQFAFIMYAKQSKQGCQYAARKLA